MLPIKGTGGIVKAYRWRTPLQCTRCTHMAIGFWCHIPRERQYGMVFELFSWRKRHIPTRPHTHG